MLIGGVDTKPGPGHAGREWPLPGLLLLVLLLLVPASATALSIEWESSIGGPGDEGLAWLAPLPDGGLLLAGNTSTDANGGSDLLLVRTDDRGRAVRTVRHGTGPAEELASAGALLPDGGAAVVGVVKSGARPPALQILRVDARLDLLWERTYPAASGPDAAYGVAGLPDGGLLVLAGQGKGAARSLLLLRLEPDGAERWRRALVSRPGLARAGVFARLPDGGFLVAGADDRSLQHDLDLFLIRLDAGGRLLWERSYPVPGSNVLPSAMAPAPDRGVVLAGTIDGPDGLRPFATAVDPFGRTMWAWTGTPADGPVEVGAVVFAGDACLVVGSSATVRGETPRLALVELDPDGLERSRNVAPADGGAERGRAAAVLESQVVLGIEARSGWTHGTDLLLRSITMVAAPAQEASAPVTPVAGHPVESRAATIPLSAAADPGAAAPVSPLLGIGACGVAAFLIRRR